MNIRLRFEFSVCDKPHETGMDSIETFFLRADKKRLAENSQTLLRLQKYVFFFFFEISEYNGMQENINNNRQTGV